MGKPGQPLRNEVQGTQGTPLQGAQREHTGCSQIPEDPRGLGTHRMLPAGARTTNTQSTPNLQQFSLFLAHKPSLLALFSKVSFSWLF